MPDHDGSWRFWYYLHIDLFSSRSVQMPSRKLPDFRGFLPRWFHKQIPSNFPEVNTVCLTLIRLFWYGSIFFLQRFKCIQLLLQNLSKQCVFSLGEARISSILHDKYHKFLGFFYTFDFLTASVAYQFMFAIHDLNRSQLNELESLTHSFL